MKKILSISLVVAATMLMSLQVSAQSNTSAETSGFSVSSFFSTLYSEFTEGMETVFSARQVDGSCVNGIQEHWQVNWWGGYIPGTLTQTACSE